MACRPLAPAVAACCITRHWSADDLTAGGPAGEVEANVLFRFGAERLHEAPEALGVYRPPHSAARSKLTSLRTKALYRECAESDPELARRS